VNVWIYSGGFFDVAGREQEQEGLNAQMIDPSFWDDRENAQQVVGRLSACKAILEPFRQLKSRCEDFLALAELIAEDGPESELLAEAGSAWKALEKELDRLEMLSFLGGRFDRGNAIITLHAGSGGTESCDWANMLLRMYTRWVERHGYSAQIAELQSGEVAGIKRATVMVQGDYAYGYLRGEHGVHRLVRISPFDSSKRRHTSFAALDVVPEIDDEIEVEIEDKDLRMDTFRASGAGGQHVNTTDSAVRITHVPTGIVVSCQNERSQHQNRHTAMRILRSKLYERQRQEMDDLREEASGPKDENAFGSQIRSYVLHPYQMVKDLRTDAETSNTAAVLDGDLDLFIEAFLKSQKGAGN
jgi:peptide chain release factor 2